MHANHVEDVFLTTLRSLAITAAIVLLGACAATPQPQPVANRSIAPTAAAPSAPAKVAADDHATALAKRASELGYQVEKHKGQPFYCLTSAQLGTRFQTKGCLSEADFESVVRRSEQLKIIELQPSSCSGAGCVNH